MYYSDSTNPDPAAPPTASTTSTALAQMKLEGLILQGCQAPTLPLVSMVTASSANCSWTATAGGTASTGYDWKVVAAGAGSLGTAVSSGTTASGVVTASATGLSSSTSYDFYVRNNCSGATNSGWAGPTNFATPCSTISLNVIQGFEAGTTIPICWTSTFVSGTKAFSYGTTTSAVGTSPNPAAATGSNRLLFPSFSTSGSQTRLSSPPIVTTGTSSIDVGFQWYHSTLGGATSYLTEGVQVQYSTNGTTWTNAGSLILRYGATSAWATKNVTLPTAAGNQPALYVGFLFTSNAGYDSFMDDITVKPSPACTGAPMASTVTVSSSVTCPGGSATLTATTPSTSFTGLSYVWQESTNSGTSWSNISGNPSVTPYTVSSINTNTQYRYNTTCSNSSLSTPSNAVAVNIISTSTAAVSSTSSVCAGATASNATISLSGTLPTTGVTYLWQVSIDGGATYNTAAGVNANATYAATVTGSSLFRCIVNCGANPINSAPASVDVASCNYQILQLPNNNTYISIATTGNSAPGWVNSTATNGDDNTTTDLQIGFPFFFKGQTYSVLRASTNGWISFTPGTTTTVFTNDIASGTPSRMLAPLFDDWVTQGNTFASLATSFKYQTSGTAPFGSKSTVWSSTTCLVFERSSQRSKSISLCYPIVKKRC